MSGATVASQIETRRHRAAARIFHSRARLERLCTDICDHAITYAEAEAR
jgi:hypothetical protein